MDFALYLPTCFPIISFDCVERNFLYMHQGLCFSKIARQRHARGSAIMGTGQADEPSFYMKTVHYYSKCIIIIVCLHKSKATQHPWVNGSTLYRPSLYSLWILVTVTWISHVGTVNNLTEHDEHAAYHVMTKKAHSIKGAWLICYRV